MSPIETQLIAAIREVRPDGICLSDQTGIQTTIEWTGENDWGVWDVYASDHWNIQYAGTGRIVTVYRRTKFSSYILDIVLKTASKLLAVECDGHDFHERTKQQASSDRARDRELLRAGIPTIRFTGSDIVHYADRCAAEVYQTLLAIAGAS